MTILIMEDEDGKEHKIGKYEPKASPVQRGVIGEAEIKEAFVKEFSYEYLDMMENKKTIDIKESLWMAFTHGFQAGLRKKNI